MVDVGRLWRKMGTLVVSALAGLLIFWVALHCKGSDWFYSETFADVLYTSVRSFHQLPLFSFVFNGGTYFLQDPQGSLFSPSALAVVAFGPTVGLRLMIAIWAGFGCYLSIAWLRRRVHETAAQLGALAWVLSLGFLWHIAVGNDMFMWHLALPGLMLLAENVLAEVSLSSALGLGLALGLLLLGPSFHSLTYLLVPALLLFVPLQVVITPRGIANTARAAGLFALSIAVALLIASPKFACWAHFPMSRPVADPGALELKAAIRGLLDCAAVRWESVPNVSVAGAAPTFTLGTEETASALPLPAALLGLVGLAFSFQKAKRRPTAIFALSLIVLGLTLSCSTVLWHYIREATSGSIRASQRFLGLAGFGLALFTALGADVLFRRWPKATWPLTGVVAALFIASPVWWVRAAGQSTDRRRDDTVSEEAIRPLEALSEERERAAELRSKGYRDLVQFRRGKREIIKGRGYTDGYPIVGNRHQLKLFRGNRWLKRPVSIVANGIDPANVRVEHTRIKLLNVPGRAVVKLHIRKPAFGFTVETVPPGKRVSLKFRGKGKRAACVLTNRSRAKLSRVILRPELPISWTWFTISGASLLAAAGGLGLLRRASRPGEHSRTSTPPPPDLGFERATDGVRPRSDGIGP